MIVVLGVAALVAGAAGGWWSYSRGQAAEAKLLRASGLLEANEVKLSSEVGGRLATRPVREGERVRQGSVLATFDTELLDHQIQTTDTVTRLHLERVRERQTLRSPLEGWVVRTVFNPAEQVPPTAPVVVVADWRELTLKVYLPEDRFGQVAVGQSAAITVDAYPGERFAGEVSFIASEAEFTPRNVQTREDRVKSVYALKLRVPNADLRLKPGMFADAVFTAVDRG
ncbi:MAG: efflux RND transporter periplasmic adaptor subunit [Chloroflexota bacterium]